MNQRVDHTGERYGRLVVEGFSHRGKHRESYWLCACDCGQKHVAAWGNLRSGDIRSCGCLHDDAAKRVHLKHGKTGTRTYWIWKALNGRCKNPNYPKWDRYGGRGIRVCERWQNDFSAFLADMGERPPGRTLDRIDNNGDYEPGNCRWATSFEQARNKANTRRIEIDGELLTVTECAERYGVNWRTINERLARGVDPVAAVKTRGKLYGGRNGLPARVVKKSRDEIQTA